MVSNINNSWSCIRDDDDTNLYTQYLPDTNKFSPLALVCSSTHTAYNSLLLLGSIEYEAFEELSNEGNELVYYDNLLERLVFTIPKNNDIR